MIEQINQQTLKQAIDLVNRVFNEFVAVDYPQEGQETFHNYMINKHAELSSELLSGHKKMWGYFIDDRIVGVIATREISHISLFFVDKEFHGRGIGKKLFLNLLNELSNNSEIKKITVNASPFGVKIYEHLGLRKTAERQELNGIIFTPMEYII